MDDNAGRMKSYVIRAARMSDAQRRAYKTYYDRWVIEPEMPLDLQKIFPKASRRIVEIGFGMGAATRQIAMDHPDWGILAIEVHKPGIGKLLWWIEEDKISNIRIAEQDAAYLVRDRLPENSVDAVHVWFPDPWPKKRHHKRRLLNKIFLTDVLKVLKPGARFHAVTDWEHYALQIRDTLDEMPGWRNLYNSWAPKPEYRPETKFERKGLISQHKIHDIIFTKIKESL